MVLGKKVYISVVLYFRALNCQTHMLAIHKSLLEKMMVMAEGIQGKDDKQEILELCDLSVEVAKHSKKCGCDTVEASFRAAATSSVI